MSIQRSSLGRDGESHVANYLRNDGFTIIAHNYALKNGEIDLIARKKDLLLFVEVKTRRGTPLFDMTELVGHSKQKKIISVAKQFLAQHNIMDVDCRFDVALVIQQQRTFELSYIPDAFQETL